MATTKKTTTEETEVIDDGKVDLFIPRDSSTDDPNAFVSVNGVNYLMPRGKTSRVPAFVADEWHRAEAAKEKFYATVEQYLSKD